MSRRSWIPSLTRARCFDRSAACARNCRARDDGTLRRCVEDRRVAFFYFQADSGFRTGCLFGNLRSGGEGGIRTPGTGLGQYDGLANRCFRPLSHLSVRWKTWPVLSIVAQQRPRPRCFAADMLQAAYAHHSSHSTRLRDLAGRSIAGADALQSECSSHSCAPVAQLDRAFASGAKGRWFESTRAYHIPNDLTDFRFTFSLATSPALSATPGGSVVASRPLWRTRTVLDRVSLRVPSVRRNLP